MQSITLQAPAKVNLQVRAGPLRDDRYHDITLVYQAISLYDTLTITYQKGVTINISGTQSERIPTDDANLVLKAAKALGAHVGIEPQLHFDLVKVIPTQAGLGGGSSDAAAALVGCNILWGSNVSDDDLMAIGARLGEDVPFFIMGMMALGSGHRQPLVSLQAGAHRWNWVLGVLSVGLSTKEVFGKYDQLSGQVESAKEYAINRQRCIGISWDIQPQDLTSALVNDLEAPSVELLSEIDVALRAGKKAGAIASLMSGSGSTCAFLAKDEAHAKDLKLELQQATVFKDVLLASGPVEGVRILHEQK